MLTDKIARRTAIAAMCAVFLIATASAWAQESRSDHSSAPKAVGTDEKEAEKIPIRYPFQLDPSLTIREFWNIGKRANKKSSLCRLKSCEAELEKEEKTPEKFVQDYWPIFGTFGYKTFNPDQMEPSFVDGQIQSITFRQTLKGNNICEDVRQAYEDAKSFVEASYIVDSRENPNNDEGVVSGCASLGATGLAPMRLPPIQWSGGTKDYSVGLLGVLCSCDTKSYTFPPCGNAKLICLLYLEYTYNNSIWWQRTKAGINKDNADRNKKETDLYDKTKSNL